MLKLATVFSGIGAIEHALDRMNLDYEIVFACDNGEINVWEGKDDTERHDFEKKLNNTSHFDERKKLLDGLYRSTKKENFVEKTYKENYKIQNDQFHYDVNYLDGKQYENEVDLFVGGSPCQSFSLVGKQKGFTDHRGQLFYEYIRLVKEIKPKVFIYENVKGIMSNDNGNTWSIMQEEFNKLGYKWSYNILNARDYGVPQNRERLFVVGFLDTYVDFKFPAKKELKTKLRDFLVDIVPQKYYLKDKGIKFVTDQKNISKRYTQINGDVQLCQKANQQFNWHGDFIMEPAVEEKYFLSEKIKKYVMETGTKGFYSQPEIDLEVARPLLSTMAKMHRAGVDNYVTTQGRLRKLTPRECLRLMGFCDTFKQVVSDTQMYKQAGNSIVVDVLINLVNSILDAVDFDYSTEKDKAI